MTSDHMPAGESRPQTNPPRIPVLKRGLFIALPLLCVLLLILWLKQRNRETTDDAFIDADVVQISPHVSGYVDQVDVQDNQRVNSGRLLLTIDPRDYALHVRQAEAQLQVAQAQHGASTQDVSVVSTTTAAIIQEARSAVETALADEQRAKAEQAGAVAQADLARADANRYQTLFDKEEISRQRLDQALATQRAAVAQEEAAQRLVRVATGRVGEARARLAEAQSGPGQVALKKDQQTMGAASVAEAQAALAEAQLNLDYTRLTAPMAGKVTRKNVLPGQWVQPGVVLLALVSNQPWVTANFKETQLTRMRRGQRVILRVDAYPDQEWHGHIDSFQAGTGSRFSLLPAENATGNYVKVVQRIPVKIVFDETPDKLSRLAPGMSVTPEVQLDSSTTP